MNFIKAFLAYFACIALIFLLIFVALRDKDLAATKNDIIKEEMVKTGFPAEILMGKIIDMYSPLKRMTLKEECYPEEFQATSVVWKKDATFFDVAIEHYVSFQIMIYKKFHF